MFKTIGSELWHRVVLSYKSTLLSILLAAGLLVLDHFTGWLTQVHPELAPTLGVLTTLFGAALKSKQAALAQAAKAEMSATALPAAGSTTSTTPPTSGFATAWVLLGLALACLAVLAIPTRSRADDPVGGACWDTVHIGKFCLQPNVAVGLVEVNLDSGKVSTGLDPVLGYEATAWGGKVGLGFHLGFRGTSSEDERILPMIGVSAFQYLRLEIGKPFKGDGDWRAFIGLGTSLGSKSST